MDGTRTQFTLLEGYRCEGHLGSRSNSRCTLRSKHRQSVRVGLHKLPSLARVLPEFNRNDRGKGTVAGEANGQWGVWNKDPEILIVSSRRESEVESSTAPEKFGTLWSTYNFPPRRGVGSNEFGTDYGLACGAEEFPVGDALERPEAIFLPDWDPLRRRIRIRWREVRLRM